MSFQSTSFHRITSEKINCTSGWTHSQRGFSLTLRLLSFDMDDVDLT